MATPKCGAGSFYNTLTSFCEFCIDNCQKCSSKLSCDSCIKGYKYDSSSNQCLFVFGSSIRIETVLLIVCFSVVAVVMILSVVVAYQRYRRRRAIDLQRTTGLGQQPQNAENTETKEENIIFSSTQCIYAYNPREICSICLSESTDVLSGCKHQFHFRCLMDWYINRPRCPNCNATHIIIKVACLKCMKYSVRTKMCRANCRSSDHSRCLLTRIQGLVCVSCMQQEQQRQARMPSAEQLPNQSMEAKIQKK